MQVKEEVLKHITRAGACGYGIEDVKGAKSIQDLINLLLTPKGVEHCMEFQFPTIATLERYKDELLANNVFVTGEHSLINPKGFVVVFGGSVMIQVDSFNVVDVYATNDAKVIVNASGNAFVSIELFHDAISEVNSIDQSKVRVYER